ncbi:MAG: hypothetical protein RMK31_08815, partial [Candidatus Caldarchaeum sp.]|nr:hypothetical protein [Candidatus Caldarchaeum sp.]
MSKDGNKFPLNSVHFSPCSSEQRYRIPQTADNIRKQSTEKVSTLAPAKLTRVIQPSSDGFLEFVSVLHIIFS